MIKKENSLFDTGVCVWIESFSFDQTNEKPIISFIIIIILTILITIILDVFFSFCPVFLYPSYALFLLSITCLHSVLHSVGDVQLDQKKR